jgi:hypothetical protein
MPQAHKGNQPLSLKMRGELEKMTTETQTMPTGIHWQGKKMEGERLVLPFQTIKTMNEGWRYGKRRRSPGVTVKLIREVI